MEAVWTSCSWMAVYVEKCPKPYAQCGSGIDLSYYVRTVVCCRLVVVDWWLMIWFDFQLDADLVVGR